MHVWKEVCGRGLNGGDVLDLVARDLGADHLDAGLAQPGMLQEEPGSEISSLRDFSA